MFDVSGLFVSAVGEGCESGVGDQGEEGIEEEEVIAERTSQVCCFKKSRTSCVADEMIQLPS